MLPEIPIPSIPDWEKIPWGETPYKGVSIYKIEGKPDSITPDVPLYSIFALKMEPGAIIPLHKHNRKEPDWTETIIFPNGGKFYVGDEQGFKETPIDTKDRYEIIIHADEIFGLKNADSLRSQHFLSIMNREFTGYEEIEEFKTK